MLRNTLILPESDARLAAKMLQEAIDRLDVILMMVFGKGDDVLQIVEWADQLPEACVQQHGSSTLRDTIIPEVPNDVRLEARRFAEESVARIKEQVFPVHSLAS